MFYGDIINHVYSGWQAGSKVSSVCAPEVYGLFYVYIPSTYGSFVQQSYEGVKTTDLRSSVDLLPGLMNNLQNYVELSYKFLSVQCIQEFPWELVAMTTSSYQDSLLITLEWPDYLCRWGQLFCPVLACSLHNAPMPIIQDVLRTKKLSIKASPGDGHCLFYSLLSSWNSQLYNQPRLTLQQVKDLLYVMNFTWTLTYMHQVLVWIKLPLINNWNST